MCRDTRTSSVACDAIGKRVSQSALAGYLWGTIFVVDLAAITVTYVTAAFFAAAGIRLYQDLTVGVDSTPVATTTEIIHPLSGVG